MRSFLLFLVFFGLYFTAQPGNAASYQDGTLGALYNDCLDALEYSATPSAFYKTQCGAVAEGYVSALLLSRRTIPGAPDKNDPCFAVKEEAYARINNRFCDRWPRFEEKKAKPSVLVPQIAQLIARWIDFQRSSHGDPLSRPVQEALDDMLAPGAFCDSLAEEKGAVKPPVIHPALLKADWKDYLTVRNNITLEQKYAQCLQDYQGAGGNEKQFGGTRCGGEITGFIAGLYAAEPARPRGKIPTECAPQLNRLYRALDVSEAMCVKRSSSPLKIAKLFFGRVESMPESARKDYTGLPGLNALGAVGYEAVYSGSMCLK